jgi:ubiquitin carboxyl-terminal hydrolase L5
MATSLAAIFSGTTGIQVEELWCLDDEQFAHLKPVHGLVFLFKWVPDENPAGTVVQDDRANQMFFAKQVIQNACATQAILAVLLNSEQTDTMSLGSTLEGFKEFSSSFDATMKGLALSNSDEIRTVHNSFSRQNLFEFDQKAASKDDDVFHFVSYVPVKGRLYELDGLKEGPVDHGAFPEGGDWLALARPIIEQRMAKYQAGEIHFNLMAIVQDKLERYRTQIEGLSVSFPDYCIFIKQLSNNAFVHVFTQGSGDQGRLADLQIRISEEEEKRKMWRKENVRRRHNYLPFIVEMLKSLGNQGQLMPVYERAKEKAVEQDEKKKEKKEEQKAAA